MAGLQYHGWKADAIEYLYGLGGHFVLCLPDKTPLLDRCGRRRKWRQRRESLDQVLAHLHAGGVLAHVPAALGLSALDVDQGGLEPGFHTLIEEYPPLCALPSSQPGRAHLYYHDNEARDNANWSAYNCSGEVRSGSGYLCLWHDGPIRLAEALSSPPPQTSSFPLFAWGGMEPPPREPREPRTGPPDQPDDLDLRFIHEGARNKSLVIALRTWGFRHGLTHDHHQFLAEMQAQGTAFNHLYPDPLPPAEVKSTSKSVTGFVWREWTADVKGFPDAREAALKSARVRRANARARDIQILDLIAKGLTPTVVANHPSVMEANQGKPVHANLVRYIRHRGLIPDLKNLEDMREKESSVPPANDKQIVWCPGTSTNEHIVTVPGTSSREGRPPMVTESSRRVLDLHKAGKSQRAIAAALGISKGKIYQVIHGSVGDHRSIARKRPTNGAGVRKGSLPTTLIEEKSLCHNEAASRGQEDTAISRSDSLLKGFPDAREAALKSATVRRANALARDTQILELLANGLIPADVANHPSVMEANKGRPVHPSLVRYVRRRGLIPDPKNLEDMHQEEIGMPAADDKHIVEVPGTPSKGGRPRAPAAVDAHILELRQAGKSLRQIAAEVGYSKGKIHSVLKAAR